MSASRHDDTRSRINTTVRKDLMAPFKNSKKYAFYWRLKQSLDAKKRFRQVKKLESDDFGFERAM